jgi:hypothetical protein
LHKQGMLGTLRPFQNLLFHIVADFGCHKPTVFIPIRQATLPIHQYLYEETPPILLTQGFTLIARR